MQQSRIIYEPGVLTMLSRIHASIAARSWFPASDDARRQLANYILHYYERGMVDCEGLQALCITAAIHKFLYRGPIALSQRRVLVVEDDYNEAQELKEMVLSRGSSVLGPVSHWREGLELVCHAPLPPTSAILDICLTDGDVFPLADHLSAQGIPFAFLSGKNVGVPSYHRTVRYFAKPADCRELIRFVSASVD